MDLDLEIHNARALRFNWSQRYQILYLVDFTLSYLESVLTDNIKKILFISIILASTQRSLTQKRSIKSNYLHALIYWIWTRIWDWQPSSWKNDHNNHHHHTLLHLQRASSWRNDQWSICRILTYKPNKNSFFSLFSANKCIHRSNVSV